jgi:acyl-ACP thioesterase
MITQAYILILRIFILCARARVRACENHVQKWRTGEPFLVSYHKEMFQEVDNEIYYDKIESILPSEFERCVVPLLPLKDLSS